MTERRVWSAHVTTVNMAGGQRSQVDYREA
jgi:hypothetical protein